MTHPTTDQLSRTTPRPTGEAPSPVFTAPVEPVQEPHGFTPAQILWVVFWVLVALGIAGLLLQPADWGTTLEGLRYSVEHVRTGRLPR